MMDSAMRRTLFSRSLFLQSLWSFENMQGLGFGFCMEPWLRRTRQDAGERAAALARHCEPFNTQPYMAGLALGMTCAIEEDIAARRAPERAALEERVRALKRAVAGPLAAIGDSFFWGAWRPFCAAWAMAAGAAAILCGAGEAAAALVVAGCFVAVYSTTVLAVRWFGLGFGYEWQDRLAQGLAPFRWQERVRLVRLAGLALATGCAAAALFSIMADSPARGALCVAAAAAGWTARSRNVTVRRLYAGTWVAGTLAAAAGLPW